MQHHDGMETSHQTILTLAAQRGLIRPRDLSALGLPSVALTRLVRQGLLTRVGRGLYARPDRSVSEHGTLAEAARKHPQAIVCLLSALRVHDLTTQSPFEVWLAIPSRAAISFKDFTSPDSSIASQRCPLASASWMEVGATFQGLTGAVSPFGGFVTSVSGHPAFLVWLKLIFHFNGARHGRQSTRSSQRRREPSP